VLQDEVAHFRLHPGRWGQHRPLEELLQVGVVGIDRQGSGPRELLPDYMPDEGQSVLILRLPETMIRGNETQTLNSETFSSDFTFNFTRS
jgi:hypothetical protein